MKAVVKTLFQQRLLTLDGILSAMELIHEESGERSLEMLQKVSFDHFTTFLRKIAGMFFAFGLLVKIIHAIYLFFLR